MKNKKQIQTIFPAKEWQLNRLEKLPPHKPGWWWDQVKYELFPSEYAKQNLELWDELFIKYFAIRLKEDSKHPLWHYIFPMPYRNYPDIIELANGFRALGGQIEQIMPMLFSNDKIQNKKAFINEINVAGMLLDLGMSVNKIDITSKGGPDFLIKKENQQDIFIEVKSFLPIRDDSFYYDSFMPHFFPQTDLHYNITYLVPAIVLIERARMRDSKSVDHQNAISISDLLTYPLSRNVRF